MAERGLKALENWAKQVTTGYNGVNVKDMSSSFRDGLAFCAIIHHYYPELIDFESLSKENILNNNLLAFSVAEKQLGVPALLDAEDMVKYAVPDRLSVITYLSQLHNCFENQNKVSRLKPIAKRIHKDQDGPPSKVPLNEQKNSVGRSYELCQVCKHRVYILERLMVSGKLYHRTCFRCHKCDTILQPGAYVESDTLGVYECAICPHDEKEVKPSEETPSEDSLIKPSIRLQNSQKSIESSPSISPAVSPKLYSSTFNSARNSFLQKSINSDDANEHDTSANSSLSELSSMSLEAGTEETQSSSLEVNENEVSKKHDSKFLSKSDADSFYESSLEKDLTSSRKPYQSVFTREISSLKPLTIRTEKPGFLSNSRPNFQSQLSNGARTNVYNIPVIKSSRLSPLSLPRPRSVGNFQQKVNNETISHRRGSLDANNSCDQHFEANTSADSKNQNLSSENEEVLNSTHEETRHVSKMVAAFESNSQESLDSRRNSQLSVKDLIRMREESLQPTKPPEVVNVVPIPKIRLSKIRAKSDTSGTMTFIQNTDRHSVDNCDSSEIVTDTSINRHRSLPEDCMSQSSVVKIKSEENISSTDDQESRKMFVSEYNLKTETANDVSDINPFDSGDEDTISNVEYVSKQIGDNEVSKILETSEVKPLNLSPSEKITEESSAKNLEKSDEIYSNEPFGDNEGEKPTLGDKKTSGYDESKNPFADDDDEEEEEPTLRNKKVSSYDESKNPFADDEDNEEEQPTLRNKKISDYDESKNPFADDEDDEEYDVKYKSKTNGAPPPRPPLPTVRTSITHSSPTQSISNFSDTQYSPTGSMKSTLKKRLAPKPPHVRDIFENGSQETSPNTSSQGSPTSLKMISSPKNRKTKRAPPPPSPISANKTLSLKINEKEIKNIYNAKVQMNKETKVSPTDTIQNGSPEKDNWKKKKRPAPPVPIPQRRQIKKIPVKEIQSEMKEIEEKQMELENQGRDLEELIRDRDKDEEPTIEEEEYIMQLFELVNQKNALFRRQAELMYIKRSQRLEEQQVELEFQIRCLVNKPASQKTEEDEKQEQNLIQQLLDVVDQRNDIIESIEMDRKREAEEDVTIQEQMEIKNSDLPITAEIKEKSAHKKEKERKKEEKKKKKEEKKRKMKDVAKEGGEDGKGTLRKKWF